MRILTTTFLFLLNCVVFAQNGKSDVQVEYQAFFNTDSPMKMFTTLYVNGNTAVYQEKYSTREDWKEKAKPSNAPPGSVTTVSGGVADDDYYRIDPAKNEVLFYDDIMRNKFLIKDNPPAIQWKLTEDSKTISGFQCMKAVGDFRGRQWIAWFAPEIASPFGPWKLQGLPGIILEAHDSTNKYTMKAIKVEYNKSDIITKDFTKIYETANTKPITYKQFLEDQKEAMDNAHNEIAQKMKASGATITRHHVPRSGEELEFEWEKL
ncbi:MAG: hypothetical protein DI539_02745 [Flavobacterium psychrophilum]|nr:MAG: hypothetical protein DI539_02745 [Flavobacterium psychrophilum]